MDDSAGGSRLSGGAATAGIGVGAAGKLAVLSRWRFALLSTP